MEDLPRNEPFQASHHLSLAAAFPHAPGRIGLGLLVPAQPYDSDAVEGAIGLAVAATIEAVPDGFARTGGQGADAAEGSKGCIPAQALVMVTHRHQQRGSSVDTDTVGLPQSRADLDGELVELLQ